MTVEVAVVGIEVSARHGVTDDERAQPQPFRFDVALVLADAAAATTDRLEDTVDYRCVLACVHEVATGAEHHLLEALAAAVAGELRRRYPVREVAVTVTKPQLELAHGAKASVTVRWP